MTTSTTTAGTTMRAIIKENYGEAENVLRLGQTGRPAIGDREVLLRVHAAGVDRGVLPEPRCLITPTRRRYLRSRHSQHLPCSDGRH